MQENIVETTTRVDSTKTLTVTVDELTYETLEEMGAQSGRTAEEQARHLIGDGIG